MRIPGSPANTVRRGAAPLSTDPIIGAVPFSRAELAPPGRVSAVPASSTAGADRPRPIVSSLIPHGVDLSGANLKFVNLSGLDLRVANLSFANLQFVTMSGAELSGANLTGANLSDADVDHANLSGANLTSADLGRARFSRANLSFANLRCAHAYETGFAGANLTGANTNGWQTNWLTVFRETALTDGRTSPLGSFSPYRS